MGRPVRSRTIASTTTSCTFTLSLKLPGSAAGASVVTGADGCEFFGGGGGSRVLARVGGSAGSLALRSSLLKSGTGSSDTRGTRGGEDKSGLEGAGGGLILAICVARSATARGTLRLLSSLSSNI